MRFADGAGNSAVCRDRGAQCGSIRPKGRGTERDQPLITPQQMRMARAGLGWSLAELAKRADVNPNTLSRYERGLDVLSGILRKVELSLKKAGALFQEDGKTVTVQLPLLPQRGKRRV